MRLCIGTLNAENGTRRLLRRRGGYLGRFDSQDEAARALIRRGCAKSLYELRQLNHRGGAVNEPPAEPSAKAEFLTEKRFGQLWAIYRTKSPDEPDRLPGDLEDAVSRATWAMSKAATPYVAFWCLLKYGPARDALEVVVHAAKGKEGAQPHHVVNVMQDALQRLSQFSISSPDVEGLDS